MNNWFKLLSNKVISVKLLFVCPWVFLARPTGGLSCLSAAIDSRELLGALQRLQPSVGQQHGEWVLRSTGTCAGRQLRSPRHEPAAERHSHTRNRERSRTVCRRGTSGTPGSPGWSRIHLARAASGRAR